MAEEKKSKPGYKTTEFWMSSIAALAGIILASGSVAEGSMVAQIVGGVMAVLATLGYTGGRVNVKKAEAAGKPAEPKTEKDLTHG